MKKKIFLPLIVITILGTSCKLGSLVYYDDVYTTSSDAQYQKKAKTTQISENSSYQYDTQSQNYDSNYYTEEAENYNNSMNIHQNILTMNIMLKTILSKKKLFKWR